MAFGDLLTGLDEALEWLDALQPRRPPAERVAVASALGWTPAHDITAPAPVPAERCAAWDGVALRAAAAEGAGVYNPVRLSLEAGDARLVRRGEALGSERDAVLESAEVVLEDSALVLVAPVARGRGVLPPGEEIAEGTLLAAAGWRLTALDRCRLQGAGVGEIDARPPPEVILAAADDGAGAATDLLAALLEDDGLGVHRPASADPAAALDALGRREAVALVAPGGMRTLAEAGAWAFPGLAVWPGEGCLLGSLGGAPMLALPSEPWPALAAFQLVLRPWLRRVAGAGAGPTRAATLVAKLTSTIGFTEAAAVALADGRAYPLARDPRLPPPGVAGIVRVPDGSEGFAAGATVTVEMITEAAGGP